MAVVITAQMVKELRDKTDAGMGDCKNALVQTEGDTLVLNGGDAGVKAAE